MCNHSTTIIPTVQRTAETAPTETEVKPVNHSNGPQCAHCGWRGGGHACFELPLPVIPRPTLSESPHAFSILPAIPSLSCYSISFSPCFRRIESPA
ncbi:hypothetical protein B0H14DRAFT_3862279 [Mycena olivaceomarginata]|nr:hypothetical protein B0H14DRAFT_3862279 [Mycena olivaceomarginata]